MERITLPPAGVDQLVVEATWDGFAYDNDAGRTAVFWLAHLAFATRPTAERFVLRIDDQVMVDLTRHAHNAQLAFFAPLPISDLRV